MHGTVDGSAWEFRADELHGRLVLPRSFKLSRHRYLFREASRFRRFAAERLATEVRVKLPGKPEIRILPTPTWWGGIALWLARL